MRASCPQNSNGSLYLLPDVNENVPQGKTRLRQSDISIVLRAIDSL